MSTSTDKITSIISKFGTISLNETDKVKFLKRTDTKYVFHKDKLNAFLEDLGNGYKVLKINNSVLQDYRTLYYDSEDHDMFSSHHNGLRDRYKIRCRQYLNSNDFFLEIKKKNNKNVTSKKRIQINELNIDTGSTEQNNFISSKTPYLPEDLIPVLENRFTRITLVQEDTPERITIDFNLSLNNPGESKLNKNSNNTDTRNLCVLEIKKNSGSKSPHLTKILKNKGIYSMGFSKYCFGALFNNPKLLINNFKPRLLILKKNKIIN